jgi:tripartite-type tricarboxylate transporter receptor subunit TctC
MIARATPDGHSLLVVAGGIMTINPLLMPNLPYDPVRDFAPITIGICAPNVLVVPASSPITTFSGFLAAARTDGLSYGSPGIGSSEHLTMAMLAQRAGAEMTHVPYGGASQALTDLLGGSLQSGFLGLGATLSHIQGGRLRPLAVSSAERSPALPEVPPVTETYPGFLAHSWQGMVAPRGTPHSALERLQQVARQALEVPETRQRLKALGFTAVASTPAEMTQAMITETQRWRDVVREAGITVG